MPGCGGLRGKPDDAPSSQRGPKTRDDFMGKLEEKIALVTGDDSSYVTGTELFVDGGFAPV